MFRHRQRRWHLEHHADARPEQIQIQVLGKDVHTVEQNLTLRTLIGIKIVHPVQHTQERGLAATGRPDKRGDAAVVNRKTDLLKRLHFAIEEIEIPDANALAGTGARCFFHRGHALAPEEPGHRAKMPVCIGALSYP